MYHIRTTKTSSSAIAVQVVRYERRKLIVAAHIGSAHNEKELSALRKSAEKWVQKKSKQLSLFPEKADCNSKIVQLDKCVYLGVRYGFIYEVLTQIIKRFKFSLPLEKKMFADLVLLRIVEPASKLRSFELLDDLFGIKYLRKDFYRLLPEFVLLKDQIESKVLALAKNEFNFDFSLVFYDVTTLYFESFQSDEFRKPGFSKDNKSQQPQILIGLIVDKEGFPVAYEVFEGNKFEGHTLIPVISAFKQKHKIDTLTVVADAAMISMENVRALNAAGLSYIVGARLANLSPKIISEIITGLKTEDNATLRLSSEHGTLICGFSSKRYRKDKFEMEKQIKKAEKILANPSRAKRVKFVKGKSDSSLELNKNLIKKTKSLLGIKGYYANLTKEEADNQTIIGHYHNLWHVEQAFRVSKSDLEIRPIYHFKEQTISAHILICFTALAVCKYMEIKTEKSTKQIVKTLRSITDARIKNTLNGELVTMRSEMNSDVKEIISKLGLSY